MILRFFSGNQPVSLLLLPLLAAVLWFPAFLGEGYVIAGEHPMPLYALVVSPLENLRWLQLVLACLLVVLQAFFINSIVNDLHFLEKRSNLPAFSYLLLHALFPEQLELSPVVLANSLLLLAFFRVYSIAGSERAGGMAFDASLLIGLAGLLHPPALLLLPVVYVALNDFRPFNGREWLLPLIGMGPPFLFSWTWFFWFDGVPEFAASLTASFTMSGTGWWSATPGFYGLASFSLLMLMASVPAFLRGVRQNVVNVSKSLLSLLWLVLLALVAALLSPVKSMHLFSLSVYPLAIWLALRHQQSKRMAVMELLTLVWIGLVFYHRFTAMRLLC